MNEQQVSESILALASAVAGKDLTDEGDGSKATALSVLGNVVGEVDADTALYNAAQFATRRSTDTKDAAASVLALSQGGGSSKELLFEETVETSGSPVAQAKLAYSQFIDADTIYVTYDGVTYTCPKVWDEQIGGNTYGSPNGSSGTPVFSDIPFSIISRSQTSPSVTESYIATETAGTHTVKVEVEGSGGGGSSFEAHSYATTTVVKGTSGIDAVMRLRLNGQIACYISPNSIISDGLTLEVLLPPNATGVDSAALFYTDKETDEEVSVPFTDYTVTDDDDFKAIHFTVPIAPDDADVPPVEDAVQSLEVLFTVS